MSSRRSCAIAGLVLATVRRLEVFHLLVPTEAILSDLSYETDRMRFIGRGNTLVNPQAMRDVAALSDSEGSVLDPIVAIQCRITLDPEQTATVAIISGIGETRDVCLTLIEKYQDRHVTDRVFGLARNHSQSVLRQINATQADAQLYGRLADSIIYANASLRADPGILITTASDNLVCGAMQFPGIYRSCCCRLGTGPYRFGA